nr:DUF2726 domain-containing protein [Candidatus Gracilibacteria bacterium]
MIGFIFVIIIVYLVVLFVSLNKIKNYNPSKYRNSSLEKYKSEVYYNNIPKYSDLRIKNLFTSQELKLFYQLKEHFSNKNIFIFSKVRIADLVETKSYISRSDYFSFFGRTSQKHIDFVLTDFKGKILCLIELDGETHNYHERTIKNDRFKDELFLNIGIPLIRFKNYQFHNLKILDQYVL